MEQNKSLTAKVQEKTTKRKSYLGKRFNKFIVIDDIYYLSLLNGNKRSVICQCDCGTKKEVAVHHLTSGRTTSCGCVKAKNASDRLKKHNMTETRFYSIYSRMKARCKNKHNSFYGGRGIENEFKSFEHFKETMFETYKDDLSLERKDVNGNYSPANCEWIPFAEQSRNRRNTIRYNGESLITYCERNGLNAKLVQRRLRRGWNIDKALNTPLMINHWTFK